MSLWTIIPRIVGITSILLTTLVLLLVYPKPIPTVRVAHIGNSFQFVNDFPRSLQRISNGRIIYQDSMLHGSLSFVSLLKKGNGMLHRWNTTNAWNATLGLHDMGACTVPQLLVGYDPYLEDGSYVDHYIFDGKNPCFATNAFYNDDDDAIVDQDENDDDYAYWYDGYDTTEYDNAMQYLQYALATKTNKEWDFVIMNDQSTRPAIAKKQAVSATRLVERYSDYFITCGATPLFIATYGYVRPKINMTAAYGVHSVPDFTAKLWKGYKNYADVLQEVLPISQQPRVAPVGCAFLVVWEENFQLWERLFGDDGFHPSPLGTYLMACVVHAIMFDALPDPPPKITLMHSNNHNNDNNDNDNKNNPNVNGDEVYYEYLYENDNVDTIPTSDESSSSMWVSGPSLYFQDSRSMDLSGGSSPLPTYDEAIYFRWIAKRVVFQNYQPISFLEALEALDDDR